MHAREELILGDELSLSDKKSFAGALRHFRKAGTFQKDKCMNSKRVALSLLALCCLGGASASAQVFDEEYSHWPEDLKINGRIVVINNLQDFDGIRPVLQRAARGRNVVCLRTDPATSGPMLEELVNATGDDGSMSVISSSKMPGDLLKASLVSSQVVFIESIAADHEAILSQKSSFHQLISEGGTLIVSTAVAELLGERFLVHPKDAESKETSRGLNLLPNCVLRCVQQGESEDRTLSVIETHSPTVGVLLENQSALVLSGRKVTCFGAGSATFVLPATKIKPARMESISSRRSGEQSRQSYLVDLTEWRRDAMDRNLDPFPRETPSVPRVESGTLLIVGGGGSPRGLMRRFVELAGGPDKAKLVYVPCAEHERVDERQKMVQSWKQMGVRHATFIHTKDRKKANSDEEFLAPLKNATGIYFGGGRQWNFSDSYYGTKAHELMKNVLTRGGVIAGSSAGASIQARYLARATPIGNSRIIAPGYERGGLGFISGVAIDQHFTQRGRQKDMTQLMSVHPQLLGIGLDEATAIEVQRSVATISGRGRVFFYDTNVETIPGEPDYVAFGAGSSYDLASRKIIVDATEERAGSSERDAASEGIANDDS